MNIFSIPAFILLFVINRTLFNIYFYFLLHCWQYSKNHTNIYDEYPMAISDYRSSVLSFRVEERCNSVRISIHRDDSSVGMQPRLKGKWNTIGSMDRSENRNSLPIDPRRFAFLQGWIWNDRHDSVLLVLHQTNMPIMTNYVKVVTPSGTIAFTTEMAISIRDLGFVVWRIALKELIN